MNVGELKILLEGLNDSDEFLLFPEMEGSDGETGEPVFQEEGVGVYHNEELIFLGEVQLVEMATLLPEDEK